VSRWLRRSRLGFVTNARARRLWHFNKNWTCCRSVEYSSLSTACPLERCHMRRPALQVRWLVALQGERWVVALPDAMWSDIRRIPHPQGCILCRSSTCLCVSGSGWCHLFPSQSPVVRGLVAILLSRGRYGLCGAGWIGRVGALRQQTDHAETKAGKRHRRN
jgi:hypothetical protein